MRIHAKLIRTDEWERVHRVLGRMSNGAIADAARREMNDEMERLATRIRESIETQTFEGAGEDHSSAYTKDLQRYNVASGILLLTGAYKNSIQSRKTGADNWTVMAYDGHTNSRGDYIENSALAEIHEDGSGGIPARPHWREHLREEPQNLVTFVGGAFKGAAYSMWRGR